MSLVEISDLLENAELKREEFVRLIEPFDYEFKGILFSEMFFFYLMAGTVRPARILESGRARGQSTLILSHCFPDTQIISIEYCKDSPDVPLAYERLKDRPNVELLFGDARKIMPEIICQNDVVLIDGPKGIRGVRFAFDLLATGKAPFVFVHDTTVGSPERIFLDKLNQSVSYSDDPHFALLAHTLDGKVSDLPDDRLFSATYPEKGYGYSLACIAHAQGTNYTMLKIKGRVEEYLNKLRTGKK